jgi:sigma-B regulation protein RsbU (phosphoserine phosphatase)
VHASSLADRYATLFYGVFDEDARALQYVNAGHNSPIIVRGGRLLHRLDEGGPPVGLFSETVYQTGVVQLKPGDLIVAYTDGVVETADAAGREWGVDGLFAAITACAMRDPDAIIEAAFLALDEFSGNRQSDDATILVSVVH